ncbi:MAG: hypothetical protein J0H08_10605 [Rhizobiales bacterium]|nr:hypothetical protein [Hyphomicrobiales bacterium]
MRRTLPGGAVFARDEDVVIDLFNALPLVTRKRVAIVAFGQSVDTDVQPRDFLIDAQLGTTEPQSVAMESHRRCELSSVAGTEGPDPSFPATDANVTVLSYLLLDTTGIVSVEQWVPTQLPNLRLVANRVTALEGWRGQISGQVDTLRTDLSALADRMLAFALKNEVVDLTQQLEDLRNKVYEPGAYIYYGTDHFLTEEGSNPDHASFDAVVGEGIRFAEAGSATSTLALLNPNNVYVTLTNGFVLPKYSHGLRMDLTGYFGETRMAQYTYEATEIRQLTRSRERRRYGATREVCTNGTWWRQGTYDMAHNVFRRNGETWEVINGVPDRMPNGQVIPNGNVHWIRVRQFWIDIYQEPYWERVTSTASINGQQIAQTFLNSQDGWLSQVGLFVSRKAATGDITVLITETSFGMPDLTRVLSRTTVPVAEIKVGSVSGGIGLPSLVETRIVLPPTYLVAGRRYAVVCVTTRRPLCGDDQHRQRRGAGDLLCLDGRRLLRRQPDGRPEASALLREVRADAALGGTHRAPARRRHPRYRHPQRRNHAAGLQDRLRGPGQRRLGAARRGTERTEPLGSPGHTATSGHADRDH